MQQTAALAVRCNGTYHGVWVGPGGAELSAWAGSWATPHVCCWQQRFPAGLPWRDVMSTRAVYHGLQDSASCIANAPGLG